MGSTKVVPFLTFLSIVLLIAGPLPSSGQMLNGYFLDSIVIGSVRRFNATAIECGNPPMGDYAFQCVTENFARRAHPKSPDRTSEPEDDLGQILLSFNRTVNCLEPFESMANECGKDNDVALIEILRWLAYNGVQVRDGFMELENSRIESPCESGEETRIGSEMRQCVPEVNSSNKFLDDFCRLASGLRNCMNKIFLGDASTCPAIIEHGRFWERNFGDIQRSSKYGEALTRCFNQQVA